MVSNKEKAIRVLQSLESGDPEPLSFINPNKYIQHNLLAEDGVEGFRALLGNLPKGQTKAEVVRAYEDGDFVFTHTRYNFFGPKIGFDVFRFEEGQIVEHWDNLQEAPGTPNPSGRTMTDGAVVSTDHEQTAKNKEVIRGLLQDILVEGRMEKLPQYFDGDRYIQHNPYVADGLSGLGEALQKMAAQGVKMEYHRIHRVLGEGNFILGMSEGLFGGQPVAFYDLFRVENGKIAEHWDTIQSIPPRDEWRNQNGKF